MVASWPAATEITDQNDWKEAFPPAAKSKGDSPPLNGDARNGRASPFRNDRFPKGGRTFFHNEMSLSDTMRDASLTVDLMDHTPDAPETNSATFQTTIYSERMGLGGS